MTNEGLVSTRTVDIDFLFLDLETCTRCRGTEANISEALLRVESVLGEAGISVNVHKHLVDSEAKAKALRFISSPTIRVNGRDIALDLRESKCEACGEVCGAAGEIDCRVWFHQGKEYTEAPVPLIVDAILAGAYRGQPAASPGSGTGVPANLKRFFEAKAARKPSACCSPETQSSCCEPSEKSTCCAPERENTKVGGCGCQG